MQTQHLPVIKNFSSQQTATTKSEITSPTNAQSHINPYQISMGGNNANLPSSSEAPLVDTFSEQHSRNQNNVALNKFYQQITNDGGLSLDNHPSNYNSHHHTQH